MSQRERDVLKVLDAVEVGQRTQAEAGRLLRRTEGEMPNSGVAPPRCAGDRRDVIFIEEAVPLGRCGALTFLCPAEGSVSFPEVP